MASTDPVRSYKTFGLRNILFIGFLIISIVPVLLLATWAQKTALNKEIAAVEEKHLLLARNLTGSLSRYVIDVEAVFGVAAKDFLRCNSSQTLTGYFEIQSQNQKCDAHDASHLADILSILPGLEVLRSLTTELGELLSHDFDRARKKPGVVMFSRALLNARGKPTLYLVSADENGRIAVGSLPTDYIVNVGESISFGKLGHAAIVDQTGQVLAHPKVQWRNEIKNISMVRPVALMMQGKTGVTKFFSPALNAEMIAGYTVVPKVGWGVMIPQPFSELEERASGFRSIVYFLALFGVGVAAVISWWLARYLAQPMQAVAHAAAEVAAGRMSSRALVFNSFVAKEADDLINSFNMMADEVSLNSQRLNDAQRIAKLGNWQWDYETGALWWSDQLCCIFGLNKATLEHPMETYVDAVVVAERELVSKAIEDAYTHGLPSSLEFTLHRPNGEMRIVHQMIEIERKEGERFWRVSATVLDITERRAVEEALRKATIESEMANKSKSSFLANMSHDLRTPLNAIMGFSDLMRNHPYGPLGDARYEEYAEDIHNSGRFLLSLINDILDISKIEAGKYELTNENLCVTELIQGCLRQVSTVANEKDHSLVSSVADDVPILRGDERALIQTLNNLLSNAIKFTERGGKISVTAELDKKDRIVVRVHDTGMGMSDIDIAKALQPFEQANGLHARRHEGTGLGLFLCSNFMTLFGGSLSIKSAVGEGTSVSLHFPANRTIHKDRQPDVVLAGEKEL